MNEYLFKDKILGNFKFNLFKDTFIPTHTTNLIIQSALKIIKKSGSLLDLGCGCGIVAIIVSKNSNFNLKLHASDLSNSVKKVVNLNAVKYDLNIEVKKSNLFESWEGNKFDFILNDISGVSEEVASISPWFNNISCETGVDGTILTNNVLNQAKHYLNPNGQLIFPIISFSNKKKILNMAKDIFKDVELLERQEWPVPEEMKKHLDKLEKLKSKGHIEYNFSFGKIIGFTEIYCVQI